MKKGSGYQTEAESWLPGAADFLGEEQEQVFATQGPRANTSKHMSRARSVAEYYDLIDTWMLMQRYEEAIELNKKEMTMFLLSYNTTANALCDEIKRRENVAQATEVHRLQQIIQKARELFLQVQERFTFDGEENFEKAEQGEVEDYFDPGHPAAIEEDLTTDNEDSEEDDGGSDEYNGGAGEDDDCCDWLNGEDCNSTSG
ncbi:hypothetical protein DAPPUDRAFT_114894 [Daphnia pulex]|uniref:Uncharacterized protein n=1 Tax=Daphnia pulex TaxID=6669 RepID=E9HJM3_DAPPU|nr:hypothetical protein DAPPUDRAFT_114894 [Daphnia pulex]|eukprot:EFX68063.1 hypothetical protein DAPPUDRAFT_114894 [Daphnia pulex]